MKTTSWAFTYRDFDGIVKSGTATVHEPQEGEFYATGSHGCSKTFNSVQCWKPIRSALQSLVGVDRPLISYSEVK